MVVYGVNDTMNALEAKTIETILCFENLDTIRITRKNKETGEETVIYVPPSDMNNPKNFKDGE